MTPALPVLLAKLTSPVAEIVAVLVNWVPATAKLVLTVPVSVITPPEHGGQIAHRPNEVWRSAGLGDGGAAAGDAGDGDAERYTVATITTTRAKRWPVLLKASVVGNRPARYER